MRNYKRTRTQFSEDQICALEKLFEESHYPDSSARNELVAATGLTDSKIQVWFQNRRAKVKSINFSLNPIAIL